MRVAWNNEVKLVYDEFDEFVWNKSKLEHETVYARWNIKLTTQKLYETTRETSGQRKF